MAYSDNFPAVRPVFQADFANGGKIDPRATFSRADTASSGSWSAFSNTPTLSNSTPGTTNQYYLISLGSTADLGAGPQSWTAGKYIQWNGSVWAQVDQPIGVTYWSNEKHLSNENLLLQSQDFDTTWVVSGIGAPTGSQTAPDGTSTAWLLTCSSGTNTGPRILQTYTATASTEYTAVAHLKAGTASHGYLTIRTDGTNLYAGALLDFSAGTISVTAAGMTSQSGTVTALGSGWFKVTVTATSSSSLGSPNVNIGVSDGTAIGSYGRAVWSPVGTETLYAWGAQLSTTGTKVYDSPTTTQIARSYAPSLKYVTPATGGMARFEHSATDGQSAGTSLGILVESQSSNLVPHSADFSNWSATRSQVESSVAVGPDGTLSADRFVEDSSELGSNSHYMQSNFTTSNSTQYTMSVYAKHGGGANRYCQLRVMGVGSGFAFANFDLSNGTHVGSNGSILDGYSISAVGNGWYRLTMTFTNNSSGGTVNGMGIVLAAANSEMHQYTSDDYSGFLLYGAQCETGSFASSLVSTSGASATRAADSMSVTDASIFNGGEHSVYWEGTVNGSTADPRLFELTGATTGNRIQVFHNDGNKLMIRTTDNGVTKASVQISEAMAGNSKVVATLKNSEARLVRNGSTITSSTIDSFYSPAGIQSIKVGSNEAGGAQLDGHVKRVAYYSTALTETQAQALSN
ncbi:MAG: LamG-like jellyroll fold domain-containing protein [Burkholderiaceae bacterium]